MSKASVYFTLGNLHGKHDAKELRRELDTLPGVFQSVSAIVPVVLPWILTPPEFRATALKNSWKKWDMRS